MLGEQIQELVDRALAEDVGTGDLTTEAVVEPGRQARGWIDQEDPGAIFGFDVAEAVFRKLDPLIWWRTLRPEGEWLTDPPARIAEVSGQARALLSGERVALNLLQRLSGVATQTAIAVQAAGGTGVRVLDTRKTTPGLRALEKAAVAAAGGHNHRMGLYDAILIKENHIAMAGGVAEAVRRSLARRPEGCSVEVECRDLDEVAAALDAGADHLLLDNMGPAEVRRAADLVGGRASLEASGGITPDTVRDYATAGVQSVSLGFLTHSAPALDLSMTIEPASPAVTGASS